LTKIAHIFVLDILKLHPLINTLKNMTTDIFLEIFNTYIYIVCVGVIQIAIKEHTRRRRRENNPKASTIRVFKVE
jgi:hypothetical protein